MFTKIPEDTFNQLQMDAGVLLKTFDPSDPEEPQDEDIITATTGGVTINCTPTYSDLGQDVDNCPNGLKEMVHLDNWDCRFQTNALGTSGDVILLSLGAADKDNVTGKITPRRTVRQTDFQDLWWVGDKAGGGLLACKLKNALSYGGLSIKTTKNGKGQNTLDIKGHISIADQDDMPMEFYSIDEEPAGEFTYTAVTPVGTENPVTEGWYVLVGDSYRLTSDTEVDSNVTYYEKSST